ncbi:MAG: hypothetical protein ACYC3I_19740 [Gemmataceae bacterium]
MSAVERSSSNQATEIDWQTIHESIQAIFAALADVVQSDCPSIRSRAGKTRTSRSPLFSYRVFDVPSNPTLDPVVAGVDFSPASSGQDIVVNADLCGEESGRIWFELPEQNLPAVPDILRATAEDLARKLSEQGDRIIAALNQQKTGSSPCLGTQVNSTDIVRKEYESHS